jgi:hypothetical protein
MSSYFSLPIFWASNGNSAGHSKGWIELFIMLSGRTTKKTGQTMTITVLIEGILIIVFGLISTAEGFRLIIDKDPYALYDSLGPGSYILVLGISLIILGIVHIMINYRKLPKMESVEIGKGMRIQMLSTVIVLAIYTYLIGIVGYLIATLIFFLSEFRILGIKSWRNNLILTLIFTVTYYAVFIEFCGMVFPRGILFKWLLT